MSIKTLLDEQLEIAAGRRAPYTQLGDWVALSGISNHAKALYWHLSMHINQQRGDFEVWPTREVLAEWCGFTRPQSVDQYLNELVALDAIEIYQRRYGTNRMRKRNVYVIHQEPPEGYDGPRSLKEFYAARKASSAEFGKSPGHPEVRHTASPEVRHTASPEVRHTASPEVRHTAHELDEVKPDEVITSSPLQSPNSMAAPNLSGMEGEEGDSSSEIDRAVLDMLTGIQIPEGKRAPGSRSRKLREVANRCKEILAASDRYELTLSDLRRHLAVDLDTVRYSITSVWLARLAEDELPDPRPSRRPRPVHNQNCMQSKPSGELTAEELIARGLDPKLLPNRLRNHRSEG